MHRPSRLPGRAPSADPPLIVAVVGSREWKDLPRVERYVEAIAAKYPDAVIVSGGAKGVDETAERAARRYGLGIISYRPYEYVNMAGKPEFSITTFTNGPAAIDVVIGKSRRINPPYFKSYADAALFRNGWIVDDAEIVVAFQRDDSRGTADTIAKARAAGRTVYVY